MLAIITVLTSIAALLGTVEILDRRGIVRGEYARKSIHVGSGLILATLPHFMSWSEIVMLNVLFFIMIVLSRSMHIFTSIKDKQVSRSTFGEFLFPLSVAICALLFRNPIVYSVAVLMMALADGLASVAGTWVKSARYRVFGSDKTVFGSITFFVVACILLFGYFQAIGFMNNTVIMLIPLIAAVLTIVEGAMNRGIDNIVVPLLTGLIVQQFLF